MPWSIAKDDLRAVVMERTGGAGADVAFDAAGVPVVVNQLIDVLGAGGRLEIVAIHTKPIELNVATQLTMQDRVIGSSVGYANDHEEAIGLARSGKVKPGPFITRRMVADNIVAEGIERLMTHKDDEVKILVSMR